LQGAVYIKRGISMQIDACACLKGKRDIAVHPQAAIDYKRKIVCPNGVFSYDCAGQEMRILTPGGELDILFNSVVTDADAVRNQERFWISAWPDEEVYENIKTVIACNAQVGRHGSGISIDINGESRSGTTHQADIRDRYTAVVVIDQSDSLGYAARIREQRIELQAVGRQK